MYQIHTTIKPCQSQQSFIANYTLSGKLLIVIECNSWHRGYIIEKHLFVKTFLPLNITNIMLSVLKIGLSTLNYFKSLALKITSKVAHISCLLVGCFGLRPLVYPLSKNFLAFSKLISFLIFSFIVSFLRNK